MPIQVEGCQLDGKCSQIMKLPASRTGWLLAAFCAVACGCAQRQHADQLADDGFDARLVGSLSQMFGERPAEADSPQTGQRTSRAKPQAVRQADFEAPAPATDGEDVCCDTHCSTGTCGCCAQCPLGRLGGGRKCACLDCVERKLFMRPEPGPPPVSHRPEMPPKFLPTPTEPMWPPARAEAPEPWRGDIEVPFYGEQLVSPGRD